MKYVKGCLIITMLLGVGYSQCDANGDGLLNVLDVVIEVDCILTPGCWEGEPVCEDIDENGICDEFQGTVNDVDGNVYLTVQIGNQLWMAENLKVTHYNDGSEIQYVQQESSEPNVWENLSTGAYTVYPTDDNNASQTTCGDDCADVYGNLYNWYTVDDSRGVCPDGWHVPSDWEWLNLIWYFDFDPDDDMPIFGEESDIAGGMLKDTGTIEDGDGLWYSPNIGATNESGFTALPGGYRFDDTGYYSTLGSYGYFWSSSQWSSSDAFYRLLFYYNSNVNRYYNSKQLGMSIRCLGD